MASVLLAIALLATPGRSTSSIFDATPVADAAAHVGRLPAMGYNTWNDLRCDGVSGARIVALAEGLVASGLAARGFTFLNIDDCWHEELHGPGGELVPAAAAFPEGLGPVVDAVHGLGLKFGIYADRGFFTCAFRAGSRGREATHARQFAAWGVDYLKYDSCWAPNVRRRGALEDYATMHRALRAHAPNIQFSLCGWSGWYAPAVSAVPGVHSWRVGADCDEWGNIYEVSRTMEGLGDYAGPGRGYNDPDMLVGTSGASSVRLTPTQSRTQFLLWAVMAAPLLLGTAPGDMNAWDFETYSNEAVIAVDQDPLGVQGAVVQSDCPAHAPKDNWWCSPWSMPRDVADVWTSLLFTVAAVVAATAALLGLAGRRKTAACCVAFALWAASYTRVIAGARPVVPDCAQVWAKPLADFGVALLFVNWGGANATVACDAACLVRAGVDLGAPLPVADLAGRATLPDLAGGVDARLDAHLAGDGGSLLVKIGGRAAPLPGPWGDTLRS